MDEGIGMTCQSFDTWQDYLRVVPGGATTYGATAHAATRIDHVEHERRARSGLGALDRNTINAMFSLPHGCLVQWDDLSTDLARTLMDAPEGIVERSAGGVRRLVIASVTVEQAVVTGLPWGSGLKAAGSFAPFCQRVLLLDAGRRIPRDKLWEADYWGIGIWTFAEHGIEELVPPAPWRQQRATPAGWAFRERAYDAWLGHTGHRPLAGPPDLFGPGGITSASLTPVLDRPAIALERFLLSYARGPA